MRIHVLPSVTLWSFLIAVALAAACGGGGAKSPAATAVPPTATPDPLPHGAALSSQALKELAAFFDDNPLIGGQVAPRRYKWITPDVALFVEFDKPRADDAAALRYIGISVKGVNCAEAKPDPSFTHFDRLSASTYGQGQPAAGERGYWVSAVAVDRLKVDGKEIIPGINYDYLKSDAPACGANVPASSFTVPGEQRLSRDNMARLASFFTDPILEGGQVAPRLYRWVNTNDAIFLQFDRGNPSSTLPGYDRSMATSLRYVGIAVRGEFCQSDRPSADFPHFHRYEAPTYGQGHGGPAHSKGIWLLWIATDRFELQGRDVRPGVDRQQSLIPIDQSC